MFGRKRFLLACIGIFTLASFACGAAPNLTCLIIASIVQGAGGGALQPISQAILMESFPPAKRGAAMAAYVLGVVLAPVLGPVLGGWLTENYSWRWIFYINIPCGLAAMWMVKQFIFDPEYIRNLKPGRLDGFGFLVPGDLAGHDANRLEQGAGRRLVQFQLHLLAVGDFRHRLRRVCRAGIYAPANRSRTCGCLPTGTFCAPPFSSRSSFSCYTAS